MDTLILCLLIVIGWAVWIALRRSSRTRQVVTRSHHTVTASSEPATPRGEPSILINMPDIESGLFTAENEHQAYTAGQLVWIRYEDKSGMVTERVVEIYRPGDKRGDLHLVPKEAGPPHLRASQYSQLAIVAGALRL
jgi:hypothetical protein